MARTEAAGKVRTEMEIQVTEMDRKAKTETGIQVTEMDREAREETDSMVMATLEMLREMVQEMAASMRLTIMSVFPMKLQTAKILREMQRIMTHQSISGRRMD